MFNKSVWNVLLVVFFVFSNMATVEHVSASPLQDEAPYVPTLISPSNGETTSNPPTLCAQSSDPDGNLSGIKFEVSGGGEGDHISPWIAVDGNGTACWRDNSPWSEQDHGWQARAVDSGDHQSGASGQWIVRIQATAKSETCSVDTLSADRSAPQVVGTTINFYTAASCTNGVNRIETFVDGNGIGTIYGGSGNVSWNTNGYGAGNHVFSVKVFGNNSGTAGRSHPYDLSNSAPPQQAAIACSAKNISIFPPSPQSPGVKVTISAKGDCNTGLRAMKLLLNGSQIWEDGGNLNAIWDTKGYADGTYHFKILTCGVGDNNCSQADVKSFDFVLKSGSAAPSDPNKAFGNCEAIKIYGRTYVVVKEGSAIQLRHVPNEKTLDALGFGQSAINNKGFSDEALDTLGKGSDIPDVVIDPTGFNTFKSTFCPNTTPIVPNQNPQQNGQLPANVFDPHAQGVCPGWETRLWIEAYGRVTNNGGDLKLRDSPSLSASYSVKMPEGYKFVVKEGPVCADGYTWWKIKGDLGIGWAAEVGDKWWMAPMTDPPLPATEVPLAVTEEPVVELPETEIDQGETVACQQLADANRSIWDKLFGVEAAPGDFTWCTQYVFTQRQDMSCWGANYGNANTWDSLARTQKAIDCGISVNPSVQGSSADPADVRQGDIVVWMASSEADCNKITDPGHVAYVLSFDGTKLLVNEANRNHDGQIHENETYTISNMDCMSFIHQPKSNNAEPPPDQPNQEPEQPQNFFQKIFRSISDWFKSLGK